jgi:nucleotide-binding universal stress UspA family protein
VFHHILVPVDDRETSRNAVRHAQRLSRLLGCRLSFLHVLCGVQHEPDALIMAQIMLKEAAHGSRLPPELHTVLAGDKSVSDRILEVARDLKTDLIVIGARGSRKAGRSALGSVSSSVASGAEIPVHIVPLTESVSLRFEDRWRRATR